MWGKKTNKKTKTKNTTLWKKFQNPLEISCICAQSIPLKHIYNTAHFSGLAQALQEVAGLN